MGSSAGAGSGEFHIYRNIRRKEALRQKVKTTLLLRLDYFLANDRLFDLIFRSLLSKKRRKT